MGEMSVGAKSYKTSLRGKHQLFASVEFLRESGFLTSNSWCVVEKLNASSIGRITFHINIVEVGEVKDGSYCYTS